MKTTVMQMSFLTLFILSGCQTPDDLEQSTVFLEGVDVDMLVGTELPRPYREGYRFLGWSVTTTGETLFNGVFNATNIDRLFPVFETLPRRQEPFKETQHFAHLLDRTREGFIGVRGVRNLGGFMVETGQG